MAEQLILVDEQDNPVGTKEKLQAHQLGLLHRCFSIFLFNSQGELLLQQRALGKYHSGGLWSNTCCSHPRPGEDTMSAARRRLQEEMRLSCNLREIYTFIYQAKLDHGIMEHEFDHVLVGYTDQNPQPDPREAMAWKWIKPLELISDLELNPHHYTEWLKISIRDVLARIN